MRTKASATPTKPEKSSDRPSRIYRSDFNLSLIFFISAVLVCLPTVLGDLIPPHDVAGRYAPMLRALLDGNWLYAFHPRVPPLLLVLAAPIAGLGIDPIVALRLTSTVLFAAGVFPVFHLHRILFDRRIAIYTVILYILCSRLVRISAVGLRDSGKTTFFVVTVYGLVLFYRNKSWRAAIYVAVGAAGMTLCRGEALVFAFLALAALFLMENRLRIPTLTITFPRKVLTAFTVFAITIAPWVIQMQRMTGWPVTDYRQAVLIEKTLSGIGYSGEYPRTVKNYNTYVREHLRTQSNKDEP